MDEPNVETFMVACISIAHLSYEDSVKCTEAAREPFRQHALALAEDVYSVWLQVTEENAAEARRLNMRTVAHVIDWALRVNLNHEKEQQVQWLRLDRDAGQVHQLPAYDW